MEVILVNVLLMEYGNGTWVAQGLEYDVAAQGNSLEEVQRSFERVFVGQIIVNVHHGKEPLAGMPRAPKRYWDLVKKATYLTERPQPVYLPPEIPPAYQISASYAEYTQLST